MFFDIQPDAMIQRGCARIALNNMQMETMSVLLCSPTCNKITFLKYYTRHTQNSQTMNRQPSIKSCFLLLTSNSKGWSPIRHCQTV